MTYDLGARLQAMLITHLRRDPRVAALVADGAGPNEPVRIYDEPPADAVYPFLRLGNLDVRAYDQNEARAATFNLSFEAHSRTRGRIEATNIIQAAVTSLHRNERGVELSVVAAAAAGQLADVDANNAAGQAVSLVELRHEMSQTHREADGQSCIATATFAGIIEHPRQLYLEPSELHITTGSVTAVAGSIIRAPLATDTIRQDVRPIFRMPASWGGGELARLNINPVGFTATNTRGGGVSLPIPLSGNPIRCAVETPDRRLIAEGTMQSGQWILNAAFAPRGSEWSRMRDEMTRAKGGQSYPVKWVLEPLPPEGPLT